MASTGIETAAGQYLSLPLEKVIYGAGALSALPEEARRLGGRRALILTGQSLATRTPHVAEAEALLGELHAGTFAGIRQHAPESGIAAALELARRARADLLVSLGGGSPIDAAKALARSLAEEGDALLPHIAIPTTLSAAEFSHIAGYTDESRKAKTGFRDPRVTPRVVILDPALTLDTPEWLWLSSGIRSLDHAVETLYSPGFHPVSETLALQAIRDLFACLPRTRENPADLQARLRCQLAAWMSFFAPLSVPMGLSHRIGRSLGASYDIPHGYTSCIILPQVMRYQAAAHAPELARMAQALNLPSGGVSDAGAALQAADAVAGLVRRLGLLSRLRDVGVPQEDFEKIALEVGEQFAPAERVIEILRQAW